MTTTYENGVEVGPRVYYYPSGKVQTRFGISDGIMNGDYVSYDENGREESHIIYKKGVPVGLAGFGLNDPTEKRRPLNFYEMESNPDAPFFVSALVSKNEYTVDNKRVKTKAGKRISSHADHLNIFRYDLYIQNLTDEPITISLDSIKVLTYRKNQSNIEDIYIDETNAHEICLRHLSHVKNIAYENVEAIAKSAATTTSTTFGSETSYAKSSYNRTNATVGAGVGASASRSAAVGSRGYVFGGSRGGWAALGGSVSNTSASAYGNSSTISTSSTRTFNNGVYRQVFENETQKANEYVNREKEDTLDEIERLITSSFTIPAKEYAIREILASEDLKDYIKLVFYINSSLVL